MSTEAKYGKKVSKVCLPRIKVMVQCNECDGWFLATEILHHLRDVHHKQIEWTQEAIGAERERRAATEASGICPDSGYTISRCWDSDLCDCSLLPPTRCAGCGVALWDLEDHRVRLRERRTWRTR